METFRFHIIDSDGLSRFVEINASSKEAALKELYVKYNPLVVHNNHF
jgi:hypothetical protein